MALQGGSWERDPFGIGPIGPNLKTGGRVYRGGGGGERGATMVPRGDAAEGPPPSGFQSGAAKPGGVAERGMAMAAARGQEVGEPTSYRGGAGAPEPIGVIRGNAMTFSPGRVPGAQFAGPEVATETQARQAWNRGAALAETAAADRRQYTDPRIAALRGTYQPPGMSMLERRGELTREAYAAETRRPELVEAAETAKRTREKAEREERGRAFDTQLHGSQYGTYHPTKGMIFEPKNEDQARDQLAARNIAMESPEGAKAGMQHFEERQMIRKWLLTQPLPADFNVNAFLDAAMRNPEHWQGLVADARKVATTTRPAAPPSGAAFFAGQGPFVPGP